MLLNKWINIVAESGLELLRKQRKKQKAKQALSIGELCNSLLSNKGEALGAALAGEVVAAYAILTDQGKIDFFQMLLEKYSPDAELICRYAEAYKTENSLQAFRNLSKAVESPRQSLIRRINAASGGAEMIVKLRCDLLNSLKDNPELKMVDDDLVHLLSSWFSPGFLELKQIDWTTPAHILEKLISYEAVHEMQGWDDLRRRLENDRRCFAFFHSALPDEPIIFVEVALVKGVSNSIQDILCQDDQKEDVSKADSAIFYSISNCQAGLKGINFGNFLIKQVVMELKQELPQIKNFATLSPIPGFAPWLALVRNSENSKILTPEDLADLTLLDDKGWEQNDEVCQTVKPLLMRLCSHYLFHEKHNGKPINPVARFHLSNGASILRLNWLGDISPHGISQSFGLLVNYHYDLKTVTENHEMFINKGKIRASKEFSALL